MPSESLLTGYYGKIPTRGDFVTYNLPPSFVYPWDDWLQNAIDCSQKQLGQNWLDAYLTCPIYRFSLSPGIGGKTAWLGIIMPSVDDVGRYFPLTFCAPIPAKSNLFHVYEQYEAWFISTEKIALGTLTDGFEPQHINAMLKQQRIGLNTTNTSKQGHSENQLSFHTIAIQQSLPPSPALSTASLDTLLRDSCFSYSTWSTKGSEAISPSTLTSQGLPPIESFAALYDGKWGKWGWLHVQKKQEQESQNSPPAPGRAEPWNL